MLNRLRQKHAQDGVWFGVDIFTEDIADNFLATVWEPAIVKINALTAATEAACLILSVDETVRNPTSNVVRHKGGVETAGETETERETESERARERDSE